MSKLNLALVAAVLALSLFPSRGFAVTNAVVGTCMAGTHFTTIQAAVNAATSGSTVSVCPGNYAEQITIQTPLTLKGVSLATSEAAVIVPPAGGLAQLSLSEIFGNLYPQIWVHNTTGVTLTNLVIDNSASAQCPSGGGVLVGVLYQGSSGLMSNSLIAGAATCAHAISAFADATTNVNFTGNVLTNCGGSCVEIDFATATTASGNTITAFQQAAVGIEVQSLDGPATITNNTVTGDLAAALVVAGSADVTITGNTIASPAAGYSIYLYGAIRALVQSNHINGGAGIFIQDVGTVTSNTISKNIIKGAICGLYLKRTTGDVLTPNTFSATQNTVCPVV